jgi:hypothetical protein
MTEANRTELALQLTALYADIDAARAAWNLSLVNDLERIAPRLEIALSCPAGKKCLSPRCRRNHAVSA